MSAEQPEFSMWYERGITDAMEEFGLSEAMAKIVVGPNDDHYRDRIETFRTMSERVLATYDGATSEHLREPDIGDAQFLEQWMHGRPVTSNAPSTGSSLLEIWQSSPEGYVEVLAMTHDHLGLFDRSATDGDAA